MYWQLSAPERALTSSQAKSLRWQIFSFQVLLIYPLATASGSVSLARILILGRATRLIRPSSFGAIAGTAAIDFCKMFVSSLRLLGPDQESHAAKHFVTLTEFNSQTSRGRACYTCRSFVPW